MDAIFKINSLIRMGTINKKERFETILEPLQAIIQLALLAFCPINTKLSISNNILYIQTPGWSQTIFRTYNSDQRDDLFYLFSVIRRYNKFYSSICSKGDKYANLYNNLIEFSKIGLDNLIQTYSNTNQTSLLHTLRMYKVLLVNPFAFKDVAEEDNNENKIQEEIDDVFIKIIELYSDNHLELLNNIFNILQNDKENIQLYITTINTVMQPINNQLSKWIHDNIVF